MRGSMEEMMSPATKDPLTLMQWMRGTKIGMGATLIGVIAADANMAVGRIVDRPPVDGEIHDRDIM
jgi:hypothetical protein